MKKTSLILSTIAIFMVIMVILSVQRIRQEHARSETAFREVMPVYAYHVREKELQDVRSYTGKVESASRVSISSRINQQIKEMHKDENDRVQKGDILVTLDNRELQSRLEQVKHLIRSLESATDALEARLDGARKNKDYFEKEYQRGRALLADGVMTSSNFDRIENQYQQALTEWRSLEAEMEKMKSDLQGLKSQQEETEVLLSYTVIRADRDGIISEKLLESGALAMAGQPLYTLDVEDYYRIRFQFPQEDYPVLSEGQTVFLHFPAHGTMQSKISFIHPTLSSMQVGTAEILDIHLPGEILFQSHVPVTVIVKQRSKSPVIPVTVIFERNHKYYVYLIEDDRLVLKEIETGLKSGKLIEVPGLEKGDIAAWSALLGQNRFFDGQQVAVQDYK